MNISSKKPPRPCRSNPGNGTFFEIGYEEDGQTTDEKIDLVDLLAFALAKTGLDVKKHIDWIEHTPSSLQIMPQFVELEPHEDGSVRTLSTIQLNHPDYFPEGIFEYQHSAGADVIKSFLFGFLEWYQQCLTPILDSLETQPKYCQEFKKVFAAKNGLPQIARKVTFGKPLRLVTGEERAVVTREHSDEEHEFCDCCIFTKNIKIFAPLFESDGFICLFLFASRDQDGYAESDCRINGEDFPDGIQALNKYVATWNDEGFEARKQFVILSNDIKK